MPCPSPGDLANPGIDPKSLLSLSLSGGFFTSSAPWEARSLSRQSLSNCYALGFPGGSAGKEPACREGDPGSTPESEDPLEKGKLPTPVFLLGESHGQRSLVGYGPLGHRVGRNLLTQTHMFWALTDAEENGILS